MNTMQYDQLFTDLTPEQAAVVEGGSNMQLYNGIFFDELLWEADVVGRKNLAQLGIDNETDSISIDEGTWQFFENANFSVVGGGRSITLGPRINGYHGSELEQLGMPLNEISSFKRIDGNFPNK